MLSEALQVPQGEKQAVFSMDNGFARAAAVGGQHKNVARQGFANWQAETFGCQRRKKQHVHVRVQAVHVLTPRKRQNAPPQAFPQGFVFSAGHAAFPSGRPRIGKYQFKVVALQATQGFGQEEIAPVVGFAADVA